MKRIAILGAFAGALLCAANVRAGFVVTTTRAPITTGAFAGDTGVSLFIQNDGVGTTDPTFGAGRE